MNMKQYLEQSEKTERKFPNGTFIDRKMATHIVCVAEKLATICKDVDDIKRDLIYGKELQFSELLHAALGAVTEAEELFSAIINHIFYDALLDAANIFEEIGDIMWYQAIMLRIFGQTFEEAGRCNIEKLSARFPDKFSEESALNRDLQAERAILERHVA